MVFKTIAGGIAGGYLDGVSVDPGFVQKRKFSSVYVSCCISFQYLISRTA